MVILYLRGKKYNTTSCETYFRLIFYTVIVEEMKRMIIMDYNSRPADISQKYSMNTYRILKIIKRGTVSNARVINPDSEKITVKNNNLLRADGVGLNSENRGENTCKKKKRKD